MNYTNQFAKRYLAARLNLMVLMKYGALIWFICRVYPIAKRTYKDILNAIDLCSRYVWSLALKHTISVATVKAFGPIVKQRCNPIKLWVVNGPELHNNVLENG